MVSFDQFEDIEKVDFSSNTIHQNSMINMSKNIHKLHAQTNSALSVSNFSIEKEADTLGDQKNSTFCEPSKILESSKGDPISIHLQGE